MCCSDGYPLSSIGGCTATRSGPFAECVVDDYIIADQDIQRLLRTGSDDLHRHNVALRMGRARRVRVDPLLIGLAHSTLGVGLTEKRFQLRCRSLTFGDARYTRRWKVTACGVMGGGAGTQHEAHPNDSNELVHSLP